MQNTDETARLTGDAALIAAPPHATGASVALIQREYDPYAGRWALPGGHLDHGETGHEAAVRELREETGINLAGLHALGVYGFDNPARDPRGRYITWVGVALITPEELPTLHPADDAKEAAWWPLANLPSLAFDHDDILSAARRWYDQNKMTR